MKKIVSLLAALLLVAVALTAYAGNDAALTASARLYAADGQFVGMARFVEDSTGLLQVTVKAQGLTPGLHGVHIHAVGSCVAPFTSAGGHHNPLGHQHGLENPNGAHAGDLPNLSVNAAGQGYLSAVTGRATLSPSPVTIFDADGSAFVIHAGPDDQITDPAGNAGSRIACGIIQGE